jgi:hypothetical protein
MQPGTPQAPMTAVRATVKTGRSANTMETRPPGAIVPTLPGTAERSFRTDKVRRTGRLRGLAGAR